MPPARAGSWALGAAPAAPAPPFGGAYRNYENAGCDLKGSLGYGVVLNNGVERYENVTTIPSPIFNVAGLDTRIVGAFTVWVRRALVINADGTFSDSLDAESMVLTAEGTAPYVPTAGSGFAAVNRAVRVMEVKLSREPMEPCGNRGGQQGSAQAGAGFATCLTLDDLLEKGQTVDKSAGTAGLGGKGGGVSVEGGRGGGKGTANSLPEK
jgi:hypothetical protein